jgi:hypothetical protein
MVGNDDEDSSLQSGTFSLRATFVKINRTTKAGYPCYSRDLFEIVLHSELPLSPEKQKQRLGILLNSEQLHLSLSQKLRRFCFTQKIDRIATPALQSCSAF